MQVQERQYLLLNAEKKGLMVIIIRVIALILLLEEITVGLQIIIITKVINFFTKK